MFQDDLRECKAFSLLELLVTIAVIAIIAAIAIPNVVNITQASNEAKLQRNAQTIASVYNAAVTAGLDTNTVPDLGAAVSLIASGTNVTNGSIVQYFSVDGLSTEESILAQGRLILINGTIRVIQQ